MNPELYRISYGPRLAIIKEGTAFIKGKFLVTFYYNGYPDFEWKRGAHGMSCDICDTFEQAKTKAKYYISKEKKISLESKLHLAAKKKQEQREKGSKVKEVER